MSTAVTNHASMTEVARENSLQHGGAAATASSGQAGSVLLAKRDNAAANYSKTRSWDYVWRSGVAGGVAGCAVSRFSSQIGFVSY